MKILHQKVCGNNGHNNSGAQNFNFDLNNIDIGTISKVSAALSKINSNKDDPRADLLNSLKPYLRDNKKEKLDDYMKLLNVTKIAEVMKDLDMGQNKPNS